MKAKYCGLPLIVVLFIGCASLPPIQPIGIEPSEEELLNGVIGTYLIPPDHRGGFGSKTVYYVDCPPDTAWNLSTDLSLYSSALVRSRQIVSETGQEVVFKTEDARAPGTVYIVKQRRDQDSRKIMQTILSVESPGPAGERVDFSDDCTTIVPLARGTKITNVRYVKSRYAAAWFRQPRHFRSWTIVHADWFRSEAARILREEREEELTPSKPVLPERTSWAVVIGISKYEHAGSGGLSDLVYADDDARDFYQALVAEGWDEDHIKTLIDEAATKQNIEDALTSWLTKAGKDDLVVLYWSGHGYPDPTDMRKVYFACYDTDMAIPSRGWRMDKVVDAIQELEPRNVIVFADTCHAGKLITRGDRGIGGISVVPHIEKMRDEQDIPKGWIYMVSAETDRQAVEHSSWSNGAFTHCLIQGLSGMADADGDGQVNMLELKAYLSSAMPEETQRVLGAAKHPLIVTNSGDKDIWNLSLSPD